MMITPWQDCSFVFGKLARRVAHAVALLVVITISCDPAIAQTSARPKRLGILASNYCPWPGALAMGPSWPGDTEARLWPMLKNLAKRGWSEGRTLIVDCLEAGGRMQDVPAIAAKLVARKPDVLLGESTLGTRALKQATTKIPIVTIAPDPLGSGLVTDLARPKENVTGLAPMSFDLVAKRAELLKDLLPRFSRLAVIYEGGADPSDYQRLEKDISTAGLALGFTWTIFYTATVAEVDEVFERVSAEGYDAAYIWPSPFSYYAKASIAAAALQNRVPTISDTTEYARNGVLLSYGVQDSRLVQEAAEYVDKLLRGAKPADLPLQQPTKLELAINIGTARALGLTIPQSILLRSDEVIEEAFCRAPCR
jgi:putative ABC transport system substrate-binding protein